MDNEIVQGTIISVVSKETAKGDEYKHISVMKENSQDVLELNVFDGQADFNKLIEGNAYSFTLVTKNGYTNLDSINELPDGKQIKLSDEQVAVASDVSYKNKSVPKKSYNVKSYFTTLNKVECEIAKKGKFTYISWVEAWSKLKAIYPKSTSKVYENEQGAPYFQVFNNLMVKVGVTVEDIEHICWYPVLDNYNKAIPMDEIEVFALNKSLQRAFAKAIAMHGLGLYVFQGEDLPTVDIEEVN